MKYVIIVLCLALTGCATSPAPRTRANDPTMRIAIDADSIDRNAHVRLQNALHKSRAWIVVDRGAGFKAVDKEQRRQHVDTSERFGAAEKYAQFAKLYGVGGIIVATENCRDMHGLWGDFKRCIRSLNMVNATTGEVMATAEDEIDSRGRYNPTASWDEIVYELVENFPEYMVDNSNPNLTMKYTGPQVDYRKENQRLDRERLERERAWKPETQKRPKDYKVDPVAAGMQYYGAEENFRPVRENEIKP